MFVDHLKQKVCPFLQKMYGLLSFSDFTVENVSQQIPQERREKSSDVWRTFEMQNEKHLLKGRP